MNPSLRSIDPGSFTAALANAANTVSIVTTHGNSSRAGLTVSSVCSVCAEPPVMLVCVASDNEFCTAIEHSNTFCINILASDQQDIALTFAGLTDTPDENRFQSGDWTTLSSSAPVLKGSSVSLDCALSARHSHGTHNVYIGRVIDIVAGPEEPLVYWNREFVSVNHSSEPT